MRRVAAMVGAAGAVGLLASPALANIPNLVMQVSASNANGSATWDLNLTNASALYIPDLGNGAELFLYQLTQVDAPIDLIDGGNGNTIGRITLANVIVGGNPGDITSPARIFGFAFTVQAIGVDTAFDFDGNEYGLDQAYGAAEGFASAAVNLTDGNGDGVFMNGGLGNGQIYDATYNSGVNFASLLTGNPYNISAGAFGSNADIEDLPVPGNTVPIGFVSSISANASFTLSADDSGSVNTQFFVVPTPAGAALLGLGGLLAARRRR